MSSADDYVYLNELTHENQCPSFLLVNSKVLMEKNLQVESKEMLHFTKNNGYLINREYDELSVSQVLHVHSLLYIFTSCFSF